MVVALRDRVADLSWGSLGHGDLLYLRRVSNGRWRLEEPEHFIDDTFDNDEPMFGSLAMNKGRLSVVAAVIRPIDRIGPSPLNSGLLWFSTLEGVPRGVFDAREHCDHRVQRPGLGGAALHE
jgi:hypothetical protein